MKHCSKKRKVYNIIKRIFDIVTSIFGLIVFSPIFLIIALLIKLGIGGEKGPVFYKHKRVGKDGKTIYIYKFRSMVNNSKEIFESFTKEQKQEFAEFYKLENDPRITKLGKLLRQTSLDELPQFINILKGDMSFIGPRPVVLDELNKFGNNTKLLLSVKPGLTGWWACSGRSNITYEERVKLELFYVNNYCAKLDFLCFVKTIKCVLKKEGAR